MLSELDIFHAVDVDVVEELELIVGSVGEKSEVEAIPNVQIG